MLIYFPTRSKARAYGGKVIDNGADSLPGKRWACEARIKVHVPKDLPIKGLPKMVIPEGIKQVLVRINYSAPARAIETPEKPLESETQAMAMSLANWRKNRSKAVKIRVQDVFIK
jgi:hypothetical protein